MTAPRSSSTIWGVQAVADRCRLRTQPRRRAHSSSSPIRRAPDGHHDVRFAFIGESVTLWKSNGTTTAIFGSDKVQTLSLPNFLTLPVSLVPAHNSAAYCHPLWSSPKAEWSANVAQIDVREIVSELKSQRRQIDRAITALEAIGRTQPVDRRKSVRVRSAPSPHEMRNGATGRVIPFALEQRRS